MPAGSALRKQPIIEHMPKEQAKEPEPDKEPAKERGTDRPKDRSKPRLFHARMLVTRLEEWCVEAASPAEAEALLAAGAGHRCTPGESIQVELERLIDE